MKTFRFKQSHDVARGIFLLAFAVMCSMSVSSAEYIVDGIFRYTIVDAEKKTLTLVNTVEKPTGNLNIPAAVFYKGTYYWVINIGQSAFGDCTGLTSVTIPSSVKSIGSVAFKGCTSLMAINVEGGSTNYKSSDGVLLNNSQTNVILCPEGKQGAYVIPNSVTSIGYRAFENCSGLTSITIGNSVTSIGDYAFSGCTGLTSVTIPNSVTSIGYRAFRNCSGLTSVTINSNVIATFKQSSLGECFGNQVKQYILGNDVTSIVDWAFWGCDGLTEINVDENNTAYSSIDGVLFNKSQTELVCYPGGKQGAYTIPNSVTSIGYSAFYGCSGLTSVTIPNSETSIGSYAFEGCTGLTSVTINSNAVISKEYSLSSSLKDIFGSQVTQYVLGNDITSIGDYAFFGCTGLTSVTIGNSVTSIGGSAFYGCSGLTSVTINSNAVMSKNYTSSSSLKNIFGSQVTQYVLGNDITSIGEHAFFGCTGLTSVTIPNSVTSIGWWAFEGCTGLTSVTIGNSVTKIGRYTFSRCSSLAEINVDEDNTAYSSVDGVLFNKSQTELVCYPGGKQGAYTIPNSVTSIGDDAFSRCSGLTSVTIPNSVTRIGSYAFYGCTGLTSVTIPNSVTSIGQSAFRGCSGLTSVTIPNSVTSIGRSAFEGCTGLTSVTIPNSVTSIGGSAFSGCTGLTSVTINSNAVISEEYSPSSSLKDIFGSQVTQYVLGNDITSIGDYAFYGCTGLTSVTIPNSVTSIGGSAFEGCTGLTSVTINSNAVISKKYSPSSSLKDIFGSQVTQYVLGNDITSIGDYAFEGCSGLTSVTIPNSVTRIGRGAFRNCSGLIGINVDENNTAYSSIDGVLFNKSQTELVCYPSGKQGAYTIPNSVTSIGESAFYGCSGLTSVTIPSSVTSIGNYAFEECSGLTSVTIPNSVTSIGESAFDNCTELTSVTIPNSVTSIGERAFWDCSGLTSVTIGNSVTSIGGSAFEGCSGLTSVTIPNSVTSIGYCAFWDCSGLTDIYCHIEEPLTIDSSVFYEVPTNTCTLHVPIGSKVKYQAANVWKEFNIVEDLPTGIVSIDNSQLTIDNGVWFTLSGVRLNGKPTKAGIYIVNGKKVVIK